MDKFKKKAKFWFEEHKDDVVGAGLIAAIAMGSCVIGQVVGYYHGYAAGEQGIVSLIANGHIALDMTTHDVTE